MSPELQARFRILKIVSKDPEIGQRDLAGQLGISLGKTNYLIRALAEKGLIKISNFRRAENKFKYVYLLTPKGVRERARLTRDYLARKEMEYEALKAEIDALKRDTMASAQKRLA
jgi:EPS-associated MarR family transcriptional regulator